MGRGDPDESALLAAEPKDVDLDPDLKEQQDDPDVREQLQLLAMRHEAGCERRHEGSDRQVADDCGQACPARHPTRSGCRQQQKGKLEDRGGGCLHARSLRDVSRAPGSFISPSATTG